MSTRRQCPGRSGAAAEQVYISQASRQSKSSGVRLSSLSSRAWAMGRSCATPGARPASTSSHSDASIPASRAASSTERPLVSRIFRIQPPNSRPRPCGEGDIDRNTYYLYTHYSGKRSPSSRSGRRGLNYTRSMYSVGSVAKAPGNPSMALKKTTGPTTHSCIHCAG